MKPMIAVSTSLGEIRVELEPEAAPGTVANIVRLVTGKIYDGGSFYRTLTSDNQPDNDVRIEVIQGGIRLGDASEENAPILLERTNATGLRHLDGTISMARRSPDSATTEFFICVGDQPELNFGGRRNPDGQGFAAFGRVTEGMDVVRAIHTSPRDAQRLTPPIAIASIRLVAE